MGITLTVLYSSHDKECDGAKVLQIGVSIDKLRMAFIKFADCFYYEKVDILISKNQALQTLFLKYCVYKTT